MKKNKKEKKSHRHKKKKRSRHSSSNSEGSSSSDEEVKEVKMLKFLTEKRKLAEAERRRQKELMKATETPEEKRLRRLMKKEAKERKRKEAMGWDTDYLHYTNSDNPFGDGNLLVPFVWEKKLEREGISTTDRHEIVKKNTDKMEENRRELEKVKKRRMERELEKQRKEADQSEQQRSKEAAQFKEWERQEDQFHLEQARLRSKIRVQDGRAKPIDLLAKYIGAEEEVDAIEMHEPYIYLNGLALKDLEDLIEDIKVYRELEKGKNVEYWNDITIIVDDELSKLRKNIDKAGHREVMTDSVAKELSDLFSKKSFEELEALKERIEAKISSTTKGIDVSHWETYLSQLKAHMARARLRDRHKENLKHKLELLKAQQLQDIIKNEPIDEKIQSSEFEEKFVPLCQPSTSADFTSKSVSEEASSCENDEGNAQSAGDQSEDEGENMLMECFKEYENGGYSPTYVDVDRLEPATIITSERDDQNRLKFARMQISMSGARAQSGMSAQEEAMRYEARKGMGTDEAEFSVESGLESQIYLWSNKYRPRKPRYFNRVHTGFEWNKYNQTHYDMDNPPPKIVQGYKFNIFYPDLIDRNTTPEYSLTRCPDNPDFAILKFHAGPPYEDIAFKVVQREWEYSYKRGFRCQFHNNIFQLWYHFKRYRYRR